MTNWKEKESPKGFPGRLNWGEVYRSKGPGAGVGMDTIGQFQARPALSMVVGLLDVLLPLAEVLKAQSSYHLSLALAKGMPKDLGSK